jgi:hypothetical protein
LSAVFGVFQLAIAFFQTTIGKWVGIGIFIALAYGAGDIRGRRVEHAKCEAAAQAAVVAARTQDKTAQEQVDNSNIDTMQQLAQQKEKADARVHELEKTMADGIVSCVYGSDGQPAGGVREQPGKGAGHAPNPRPTGVPTPRPRPTGDKG